jgi:hypothetical protein
MSLGNMVKACRILGRLYEPSVTTWPPLVLSTMLLTFAILIVSVLYLLCLPGFSWTF